MSLRLSPEVQRLMGAELWRGTTGPCGPGIPRCLYGWLGLMRSEAVSMVQPSILQVHIQYTTRHSYRVLPLGRRSSCDRRNRTRSGLGDIALLMARQKNQRMNIQSTPYMCTTSMSTRRRQLSHLALPEKCCISLHNPLLRCATQSKHGT